MASHDQGNRRDGSSPQSIPLQELRPAAEPGQDDADPHTQRRRTLSDRGMSLFRNRNSGGLWGSNYVSISGGDEARLAPPNLAIPQHGSTSYDPGDTGSPVEDMAGFQSAIGFSGLSFQSAPSPSPMSFTPTAGRTASAPSLNTHDTDSSIDHDESQDYFSPVFGDTTPLTDSRHLQPISGVGPSTPSRSGAGGDRRRSIRFATPTATSLGSRLGDDLATAESGLRTPDEDKMRRSGSFSKGLSPTSAASPLRRAGTMVRNMSQRVVNLSNESEIVERSIRRKSSLKQARLDGPLALPATPEFVTDGASDELAPVEKTASVDEVPIQRRNSGPRSNPLKGRSIGIFPPDSKIRRQLCELLVHPATEPCLLFLIVIQTILLAIDSSGNITDESGLRSRRWGTSWIDYALLALFCVYTAEVVIRIIVSGFVINPVEYSTINRQIGLKQAVIQKFQTLFAPQQDEAGKQGVDSFALNQPPSVLRSFTSTAMNADFSGDPRQQQRIRLAHRAFLRHSFNRLDFVAVIAFWISFAIGITGVSSSRHTYVFDMLSCLRILRLLGLTSGTTIILRSLKKAAPLLVNVAFLIGFFWLLFAIVAVQSFKSSLRRSCVWFEPDNPSNNFTNEFQFCGGHMNASGHESPWVSSDLRPQRSSVAKGYICPQNSLCIEGKNPYNGTVSFDNILQSLELIFVIMTSNTFSDLMYYLTSSDYLAAAIFFALGIIILYFWLVNLLIAVITSSFQVIREESKASAFTAEERDTLGTTEQEQQHLPKCRTSALKRAFGKTFWLWIAIIATGLIIQCFRSANMSTQRESLIDGGETAVTFLLLFEIIVRFVVDWRNFFRSKGNVVDLSLAIVTSIMQIPSIRNSGQPYAWLTIFQILRIYRVVLAVPMTRDLIMTVLGNASGLLNLILFVFLLTFLAAIFAAQLFRGEIPFEDTDGEPIRVTFATIFNSFLGMYQILSSENWTTILYNVTNVDVFWDTAWIGAGFFILWYIFANFIVLNMFIAVIQENFDVSEDEKRLQQVKAFLQQKELGKSSTGNLSLSTIFKVGLITGRQRDPLAFGTATTEMLLKEAVVKDFLDQQGEPTASTPAEERTPVVQHRPTVMIGGSMSNFWGRFVRAITHREPNPFYSQLEFSRAYEDLDPRQMAKEVMSARERRKRAQRDYLQKHPTYNMSLFIFKPGNPIRRLCQRIVGPGRGGDRIEGVSPSPPIWYAFSAFIYAAIVAMVLLACVTTPLYQKEYFAHKDFSFMNWFLFTDIGFAALFTIEAAIKVIADGFFWTPNAYFRGSWGFIDGTVLVSLWINIGAALEKQGQVSRAVGAFKALRALRLLNISDDARNTFHSVIVRGGLKVVSAAFVSLSLLIPFAIYGLNLFLGKFQLCNDNNSNITSLSDCVDEYSNSPYNWDVLSPRQVSNPWYDFDNFGGSLFVLFQIVSLEGWTDVMWAAQSVTGRGLQPRPFASQGNAVYFVVFNLLGAVFVLTLFVSVFMRNYTEQTGVAFLTTDQRSWLELRKLLRQVAPSKRPVLSKTRDTWKEWSYRRAIRKTGRWQRFVTGVLILHLILLCLELYPDPIWWTRTRDYIFLAFTTIYIANIVIRIIGLTWTRFRKSSWDVYSLLAVSGTFVTTLLDLSDHSDIWIFGQLHKLCLVSIALLLIPRNNQLDQLFKTAAASLPTIANLMATWFVLFLVYAIALTQAFGLTRFSQNESGNVNFRNVPKALILLFRTSVGEGWNQIMEDYATVTEPYCVRGVQFSDGDCGSPEWARILFISWNILSMYIFVNLFVSLIYESFSYVYQRSSGLSIISREEIRRFKQAWAEFDPNGTGYITKEVFPRFLGELSGVFEMRIYDGDFTVRRLIEDCSVARRESNLPMDDHAATREIDIKKLNQRLAELPIGEIRRRRARMNNFYEEVIVSSDPDKGIAFNALLRILAHYKVINDNKSLRLEEFLRRRARLQRVDDAVRRNVVMGFFDTIYWSRKFRSFMVRKQSGRMTAVPQFTVPEIFVDDEEIHGGGASNNNSTPISGPSANDLSPRRASDANHLGGDGSVTPPSDTRSRANSIQPTPQSSPDRPDAPRRSQSHQHAGSSTSGDWQLDIPLSRPVSPLGGESANATSNRSRQNSSVSAQDVLDVLDKSAWGESIRRSFTMRRPGSSGER